MSSFLVKNPSQQTPLGEAIINNDLEQVKILLEEGAASSIFIQGYFPGSLVCTLPQTSQPVSNCFNHPPPFHNQNPDILKLLDDALVAHITRLDIEKTDALILEQDKKNTQPVAEAAAIAAPFDFFPFELQVGDTVRRGPDW